MIRLKHAPMLPTRNAGVAVAFENSFAPEPIIQLTHRYNPLRVALGALTVNPEIMLRVARPVFRQVATKLFTADNAEGVLLTLHGGGLLRLLLG